MPLLVLFLKNKLQVILFLGMRMMMIFLVLAFVSTLEPLLESRGRKMRLKKEQLQRTPTTTKDLMMRDYSWKTEEKQNKEDERCTKKKKEKKKRNRQE